MYIKIGKRTEFTEIQLRGMYSLRAEVFKHKKAGRYRSLTVWS